jgi:excinuclease ABC subunit B
VVEQIIRPTGLIDPPVEVRPARGQVADLLTEIGKRVAAGERTLITALTKRLSEDLSEYVRNEGYRCKYLHSEIETLDRVDILRDLREGKFDVLIGVNLLREGLDLPEVSLVAILDADKQGFLRSATSLIQTIGRCARNVNATVILYADKITEAMQVAITTTLQRRKVQIEYNRVHGITPTTIIKAIRSALADQLRARKVAMEAINVSEHEYDRTEMITKLEAQMLEAAEALEFEQAARLRDRIKELKLEEETETLARNTKAAKK